MGSVAQARRNRKGRKGLPALAGIKRKKQRGRARQDELNRMEQKANLTKRCQALGLRATRENLARVNCQRLESEAGIAIELLASSERERAALCQTYDELKHCVKIDLRRSCSVSIDAKTSKIEFMPERLEASASDTVDLRTPEEKAVSSARARRVWLGRQKMIASKDRAVLDLELLNRMQGVLVVDGKATPRGRAFVNAVKALHEVVG